jgi:hypothetical protein
VRRPLGAGAVAAALVLCAALGAAAPAAGPAAGSAPGPGEGAGGWRSARTEHFLFVYEPRDAAAVRELISICEDVYQRVTAGFGSYPRTVACVVRGRLDYSNGSLSPFPPRLELILTPPSADAFGGREPSWLRLLLTHELTHYVHLTMAAGVFHAASMIFGPDAALGSGILLPGWLIEGPAVAGETLNSTGGRGRNRFFESTWKAPFLSGSPPSLPQAGYSSAFPPLGRPWLAGYFMVDYLRRHHGEDCVRRIMEDYLASPLLGPWDAIRRVTGLGADELYRNLLAESRRAYENSASVPAGALLTPDRVGDYTAPRLTARGLFVYRQDLEAFPAIIRLDAQAGVEAPLLSVSLTDPYSFTASADGGVVWLASLAFDWTPPDGERAVSDLSRLETATGALRQVTHGAHVWQPALSRDGVVLAIQGRGSASRLVAVDGDTGGLRVVYSRAGARVSTPEISPDGGRAVFVLEWRGSRTVQVMDLPAALAAAAAPGGPEEPIRDVNVELAAPLSPGDPGSQYHPSFKDDATVLYCSDADGSPALYSAPAAGGAARLIQRDPVAAFAGILAHGSLLYSSYRSTGFCLRTAPMPAGEMPGGPPPAASQAVPVAPPVPPAPAAGRGSLESFEPAAPAASGPEPVQGPASLPYVDLPAPLYWLPTLSLAVTGPGVYDVSLGLGAVGGSLLGTSSWSVGASWLAASSQPLAHVILSGTAGTLRLSLSSGLTYGYGGGLAGAYSQTLTSGVSLSLPLSSWTRMDRAGALTLAAGASHVLGIGSMTSFTAGQALSAPGWQQYLNLRASVGGRLIAAGGPGDFIHPWDLEAAAGGVIQPPILSAAGWGTLASVRAAVTVPVIPHLVLRAGMKSSYGFGTFAFARDPMVAPRGFPDAASAGTPGTLLADGEALMSLAVLDQPLPLGFALLGLAAGLHVEHMSGWDPSTPRFLPGTPVYLGAEITVLVGYSSQSLPVSLGLSARVDTAVPGGFSPARDLRPYISFSFNSFRDAGLAGPAQAWSALAAAADPPFRPVGEAPTSLW